MNRFIKKILSFLKIQKNQKNQKIQKEKPKENINIHLKNKRSMSLRENFISDAPDEETGGKVNAISQNKTLYIGQFTDTVNEPELFQEAETIEAVFDKFKPNINVEFQSEDGGYVEENLAFNNMKDFEVNNGSGQLVQNSAYLLSVKNNIDANAKMRKNIEQNKRLRDLIGNTESREELRNVLQNLLDEIEGAK
jgi:hypothetical protein